MNFLTGLAMFSKGFTFSNPCRSGFRTPLILISCFGIHHAIPYESDPEARKVRELHESKRQACWGGSLEKVGIITSKGDQRVRLLFEGDCDDSSGDGGASEEADRHRKVPQGHSSQSLTIVTCICWKIAGVRVFPSCFIQVSDRDNQERFKTWIC